MNEQARTALPVLLPALGAVTVFLLLAWRPWRSKHRTGQNQWRGHWAAPLAFALAFLLAFAVLEQSRGFQLKDRWHWILPIVGVAAACGVLAAILSNRWMTAGLALASAVAAGYFLHPVARIENPNVWKAIFAVSVLLSWLNLEPLAARRSGGMVPAALVIVFAALAFVLVQSYQAKFALIGASMATGAGVMLVLAMIDARISIARGGTLVVAAVLCSLLVMGWFYSRGAIGWWPFLLIGVSPIALWLGQIQWLRGWQRLVMGLGGVTAVAAAAVFMAILTKTGMATY